MLEGLRGACMVSRGGFKKTLNICDGLNGLIKIREKFKGSLGRGIKSIAEDWFPAP